ncbi:Ppx/GppA phosphatase family protein, partial [Actinoallomurus acaciae]
AGRIRGLPPARRAVAASKTFKQLARLTGAPGGAAGPYAHRVLRRDLLRDRIPELAACDARRRARLPGVAKSRVHQIVAGAIVAEALMTTLDLEEAEVCPWALREGIAVRRMRTTPALTVTDELGGLVQRSLDRRRVPPTFARGLGPVGRRTVTATRRGR